MTKRDVLDLIATERSLQDRKWGEQNHPDGTGLAFIDQANSIRRACDWSFKVGAGTWRHILLEEVYEAFSESNPDRLVEELIQVAAVAVAWVEAIKRRRAPPHPGPAGRGVDEEAK